MKTQVIFIKNIFVILILLTLPVTTVYAEKDLNIILKGVYAVNTNWGCIVNSSPPCLAGNPCFPPCLAGNICLLHFEENSSDLSSEQFTTAGEITYHGDGTATEVGRVVIVNHTFANRFSETYACGWEYQVNDDRTFSYSGKCRLPAVDPTRVLTNQKWNGHMGNERKTLLVERHDGEIEGILDIAEREITIVRVCNKTGTQIKLRGLN